MMATPIKTDWPQICEGRIVLAIVRVIIKTWQISSGAAPIKSLMKPWSTSVPAVFEEMHF